MTGIASGLIRDRDRESDPAWMARRAQEIATAKVSTKELGIVESMNWILGALNLADAAEERLRSVLEPLMRPSVPEPVRGGDETRAQAHGSTISLELAAFETRIRQLAQRLDEIRERL